jgi:plastocyanin
MDEMLEPGGVARRLLLRRALSASVVVLLAPRAFAAAAEGLQVVIDNFTFSPTPLTVKVGASVTWMNRDDMPHSVVFPTLKLQSHIRSAGNLRLHLRPTRVHARTSRGASIT